MLKQAVQAGRMAHAYGKTVTRGRVVTSQSMLIFRARQGRGIEEVPVSAFSV